MFDEENRFVDPWNDLYYQRALETGVILCRKELKSGWRRSLAEGCLRELQSRYGSVGLFEMKTMLEKAGVSYGMILFPGDRNHAFLAQLSDEWSSYGKSIPNISRVFVVLCHGHWFVMKCACPERGVWNVYDSNLAYADKEKYYEAAAIATGLPVRLIVMKDVPQQPPGTQECGYHAQHNAYYAYQEG